MRIAEFETSIVPNLNEEAKTLFDKKDVLNKRNIIKWFENENGVDTDLDMPGMNIILKDELIRVKNEKNSSSSGGSRRRRPSRKYKKSAKRVFRKKSRSTRRR
jgi:hypothetical protein